MLAGAECGAGGIIWCGMNCWSLFWCAFWEELTFPSGFRSNMGGTNPGLGCGGISAEAAEIEEMRTLVLFCSFKATHLV